MRISRAASALCLICVGGCEALDPPLEEGTGMPVVTERCCGGVGICAPEGFVSAEVAERLGHADCQTDTLWCVPRAWLEDPARGPNACRAPGDAEGRCLPSCLPELQARADRLSQESCDAGQLCVPCYDPLTREDTRACRFDPDPGPSDPPALTSP